MIAQYACSMCPGLFISDKTLKTHIKKVHDDEDDLYCKYCDKTYSSQKNYQFHVYNVHASQNPLIAKFGCELCSALYVNELGAKFHRKRMHPDDEVKSDSPEGLLKGLYRQPICFVLNILLTKFYDFLHVHCLIIPYKTL